MSQNNNLSHAGNRPTEAAAAENARRLEELPPENAQDAVRYIAIHLESLLTYDKLDRYYIDCIKQNVDRLNQGVNFKVLSSTGHSFINQKDYILNHAKFLKEMNERSTELTKDLLRKLSSDRVQQYIPDPEERDEYLAQNPNRVYREFPTVSRQIGRTLNDMRDAGTDDYSPQLPKVLASLDINLPTAPSHTVDPSANISGYNVHPNANNEAGYPQDFQQPNEGYGNIPEEYLQDEAAAYPAPQPPAWDRMETVPPTQYIQEDFGMMATERNENNQQRLDDPWEQEMQKMRRWSKPYDQSKLYDIITKSYHNEMQEVEAEVANAQQSRQPRHASAIPRRTTQRSRRSVNSASPVSRHHGLPQDPSQQIPVHRPQHIQAPGSHIPRIQPQAQYAPMQRPQHAPVQGSHIPRAHRPQAPQPSMQPPPVQRPPAQRPPAQRPQVQRPTVQRPAQRSFIPQPTIPRQPVQRPPARPLSPPRQPLPRQQKVKIAIRPAENLNRGPETSFEKAERLKEVEARLDFAQKRIENFVSHGHVAPSGGGAFF